MWPNWTNKAVIGVSVTVRATTRIKVRVMTEIKGVPATMRSKQYLERYLIDLYVDPNTHSILYYNPSYFDIAIPNCKSNPY
jgi:hypothetical protein